MIIATPSYRTIAWRSRPRRSGRLRWSAFSTSTSKPPALNSCTAARAGSRRAGYVVDGSNMSHSTPMRSFGRPGRGRRSRVGASRACGGEVMQARPGAARFVFRRRSFGSCSRAACRSGRSRDGTALPPSFYDRLRRIAGAPDFMQRNAKIVPPRHDWRPSRIRIGIAARRIRRVRLHRPPAGRIATWRCRTHPVLFGWSVPLRGRPRRDGLAQHWPARATDAPSPTLSHVVHTLGRCAESGAARHRRRLAGEPHAIGPAGPVEADHRRPAGRRLRPARGGGR